MDDGPWVGNAEVDVAIIGGGYAGLSCALHLAQEHGIKAVVLEANQTAWGCSGRNGSFARISGGRVPLAKMIERYGAKSARDYFDEMRSAFLTVRGLIQDGQIDCDVQPDGVFKVAAKSEHTFSLQREQQLYNDILEYPARFIGPDELKQEHAGAEAFGALRMPDGFAMHPLKLAWGIHRLARNGGAKIHTGSPVIDWSSSPTGHRLVTPGGLIKAKTVVVATNGYTSRKLNKNLNGRMLPVYSQIIVTQPLTAEERDMTIPGTGCMFDTRNLLSYYRRLPDNRILFGGRSAITGKDAESQVHKNRLLTALKNKFPELQHPKADYSWGGWVAVSQNSLPYCYHIPNTQRAYAAGGCAGSGVSFAVQMGKRLAQMVAGDEQPTNVPFLHEVPKQFPFNSFLRVGQRVAYTWLRFKDAK